MLPKGDAMCLKSVTAAATVLILAWMLVSCDDTENEYATTSPSLEASPESSVSSRYAPGGTPSPSGGPFGPAAQPDAVADVFLRRPITGSRPFSDVASYLDWLAGRPGTRSYATAAEPSNDSWLIRIELEADDRQRATAECRIGESERFFRTGVLWDACPALAGLWTSFAPDEFGSLVEARRFVPQNQVVFAPTPPEPYHLARVILPQGAEAAARDVFVVTLIYEDGQGSEIRLEQQPAGLNITVFDDYAKCDGQRWPGPGVCLAWASQGAYFLLASPTASPAALHEFERAIDARRGP